MVVKNTPPKPPYHSTAIASLFWGGPGVGHRHRRRSAPSPGRALTTPLTRGAVGSDRGVFLDCHGSNVNPERLQKQGFFHDREHGFTSRKRRDRRAFAPQRGEYRDDSLLRANQNASAAAADRRRATHLRLQ